mmetsp:Transcript_17639/g.42420  ORF Transcript_17639/g.42420 Transcript_17639/m.42420 type:complete len:202 (+) Transcript_17639:2085-2690(+)
MPGDFVGGLLHGSLGRLRLLHQRDDLTQGGARTDLCGSEYDVSSKACAATKHHVAHGLLDGLALASYQTLVNRRVPSTLFDAVDGYLSAREDLEQIAHLDELERDLAHTAVARVAVFSLDQCRCVWLQGQQAVDGLHRATFRTALEHLAQHDDSDEHGRRVEKVSRVDRMGWFGFVWLDEVLEEGDDEHQGGVAERQVGRQ